MTDKIKYFLREYFLPFERLDLSYGWRAIQNAKRAHYLDIVDDKIIVVSGKGEFIYFETKKHKYISSLVLPIFQRKFLKEIINFKDSPWLFENESKKRFIFNFKPSNCFIE